ncbi:MAG TPA: hypothetical protein VLJ38_08475, partial [Polyangiaceae bacterium]|nr:hypothetical protein [Polyangiaceae bacterium]
TADALLRLERVELDRELVQTYLACTPEPAASVTRRLLAGESPRELVLSASVSALMLEVVLSDIARRGAMLSAVTAPAGESSRPPVEEQSAPPLETNALSSLAAPLGAVGREAAFPASDAASGDATRSAQDATAALRVEGDAPNLPLDAELTPAVGGESEPMLNFGSGTKTLEGVGDAGVQVEPSGSAALDPELGVGVLGLLGEAAADADGTESASPNGTSAPVKHADAAAASSTAGGDSDAPPSSGSQAAASLPPTTSRSGEIGDPDTSPAIPAAKRRDTPKAPKSPASDPSASGAKAPDSTDSRREGTKHGTPSSAPGAALAKAPAHDATAKKGGTGTLLLRSVAAGGIAFFITTWLIVPMFSGDKDKEPAPPVEKTVAAPAAVEPAAPAPTAALSVEDLELPRGMEVAPEQGIIEVETNGPDPIYVDEAFVGVGPVRRVAAAAGTHHVEVRGEKPAGPLTLTLVAGRRAHVKAAGSPAAAPPASAQ